MQSIVNMFTPTTWMVYWRADIFEWQLCFVKFFFNLVVYWSPKLFFDELVFSIFIFFSRPDERTFKLAENCQRCIFQSLFLFFLPLSVSFLPFYFFFFFFLCVICCLHLFLCTAAWVTFDGVAPTGLVACCNSLFGMLHVYIYRQSPMFSLVTKNIF